MSLYNQGGNKLVTCPYDESHKVKASRLQLHISKCKMNNLDLVKEVCPFNATHLFDPGESNFHLANCPDRGPLDRRMTQKGLDRNNPFRGRTSVPTFSGQLDVTEDENWDEGSPSTYIPSEAPVGAIMEPLPMSKPSERKQLYKELHRAPISENDITPSTSSTNTSSVPRQPKQLSETQKMQTTQQQSTILTTQNLGLGRGKAPRIAANIFDNQNINGRPQNPTFSSMVKDVRHLGMGRGQQPAQGSPPVFKPDEDDFPALGCGRGAWHAPKQGLRTPGVRPQNY